MGAKIGGLLIGSVSQVKAEMLRLSQHFRSQDGYRQAAAKYLVEELGYCKFDKTWLHTVPAQAYFRRVGQGRDVLDTAGSLSDGGRFNIGGAQASSSATHQLGASLAQKRGALYLGEDPDVVCREYGDFGMPGSTAVTYQVAFRRKTKLRLIDIGSVLDALPIPDLKALVGNASMNGKWGDIKYPMPCQILGHWLIANAPKKTDGIRFPTSHGGGGWNVCLFFADTRACKRTLLARALQPAQGHSVTPIPDHKEMTTQEAADFLGVSRPFVVKQLEQGAIPFSRRGKHRRIKFADVRAYQQRCSVNQDQAMQDLVGLSQELKLY